MSTPPLDFLNSIQVLYDDMRQRVAAIQDQYDQMVTTKVENAKRELEFERDERRRDASKYETEIEKLQTELGILKSTESREVDELNKKLATLRGEFNSVRNQRDRLEMDLMLCQTPRKSRRSRKP